MRWSRTDEGRRLWSVSARARVDEVVEEELGVGFDADIALPGTAT